MTAGDRLGPYEIVSPLGAGGMGEVYKARDTRLERFVALKVLPERVARDPDWLARFEREAKSISALADPHICTLFDIGRHEGSAYLVMEFLEGETLAQRLKRGAMPIDQAVRIGTQIASALDKAHRRGIVHRDLKPGNVMLAAEPGRPSAANAKLLDFGLAKPDGGAGGDSETRIGSGSSAAPLTQAGDVMGTPQYMSPEQFAGSSDARSDVWALGCVLYEMLTGRRPFDVESPALALKAIVASDPPPIRDRQPDVPAALDLVVRTCLAKDPEDRFQSARDVATMLRGVVIGATDAPGVPSAAGQGAVRRDRITWGAIGLVAGALLVGAAAFTLMGPHAAPAEPIVRAVIPTPASRLFSAPRSFVAISPDGRQVVYAAVDNGVSHLYLRPLDRMDATAIRGTDGAEGPFFSPDGQRLGFFANGQLKQVTLDGAAPVKICDALDVRGAAWGDDDQIIFTPSQAAGLWRVPAGGGKPEPFTTLDTERQETTHRFPIVLPGSRAVLFVSATTDVTSYADSQIVAQPMAGGPRKVVVQGGTSPMYAQHTLLYNRGDGLVAVPFDPDRLEVTGNGKPVAIASDVAWSSSFATTHASVSSDGTVAYIPGGEVLPRKKVSWIDRAGNRTAVNIETRFYNLVRVSPDGTRLLLWDQAANDMLLVYDIGRQVLTKLPLRGNVLGAAWTPDGKNVVTVLGRHLVMAAADGSGQVRQIDKADDERAKGPPDVSTDGDTVVSAVAQPGNGVDLWAFSLKGDPAKPIFETRFNERFPRVSPNRRWLAYQSDADATGVLEVWVLELKTGKTTQVSAGGGGGPVWSFDSRELLFRSGNDIMSAQVGAGGEFAEKPRRLFTVQGPVVPIDAMPGGQRFVVLDNQPAPVPSQINLILGALGRVK